MKRMKEVTLAILIMALCCGSGLGKTVKAENVYSYDANTKLYTEKKITKGTKQMKKGARYGIYQVVKIKGNKIILRGAAGLHQSADPYFKTKKKIYKLAKKCKFYYTDVSYYSMETGKQMYKKLTKKNVRTIMTDQYSKARKEKIYDGEKYLSKKYYTGGFFGQIYMKKGKIVAILMNGGD